MRARTVTEVTEEAVAAPQFFTEDDVAVYIQVAEWAMEVDEWSKNLYSNNMTEADPCGEYFDSNYLSGTEEWELCLKVLATGKTEDAAVRERAQKELVLANRAIAKLTKLDPFTDVTALNKANELFERCMNKGLTRKHACVKRFRATLEAAKDLDVDVDLGSLAVSYTEQESLAWLNGRRDVLDAQLAHLDANPGEDFEQTDFLAKPDSELSAALKSTLENIARFQQQNTDSVYCNGKAWRNTVCKLDYTLKYIAGDDVGMYEKLQELSEDLGSNLA